MARSAKAPETEDESALIRRIANGATEEFSVIVERYQDQIYGIILRQVGVPATARDLAQETFIKAYRSLGAFRAESEFRTWLVRIALNVTSSYFSSRCYREARASVSFVPEAHDSSSHSSETSKEERATAVRDAISSLPQKYRDVVALLALEELPREQVARTLDIPLGTVASRFHKAVTLLRKNYYQEVHYDLIARALFPNVERHDES